MIISLESRGILQAKRIRAKWYSGQAPFLPEITTAASLAQHGLLRSVMWMRLKNVDLASVPAESLASLASCVTRNVDIHNVRNCDIISIMNHVKCEGLSISRQSLSSEETQALVRAMESNVEWVQLGYGDGRWDGEVILDITALTQYSGQGKCGVVKCWYGTADRYREELSSWAQGSLVTRIVKDQIIIERKLTNNNK